MATLFLLLLLQILPCISITIHSSCNSLNDGLYYIKPLANNKIIPVICNNGYSMIDPSLNFDSIIAYLSSYDYSRRTSNIFSSELNDFVNWRKWWLPSNENTLFTVSPQCNQCLINNISENNAYYMSNYYFCFKTLPNNQCNRTIDSELNIYCNKCDDIEHDTRDWSNCYGIEMTADHIIDNDHNKCVSETIMARPSMVKDRSFCTCYKPMDDDIDIKYTINNINDLPIVYLSLNERNKLPFIDENIIFAEDSSIDDIDNGDNGDINNDNIYYLTNNDFLYGTYRITKCGEYILTEDILLNFNGATIDEMNDINWSPNNYDIDNLYWWPTMEQIDIGLYRGMYDFHGLYTLGFFAGITIETNDVIINLNGYSISMDKSFYLQQRFFSIIELSNRNFIPPQGTSNLGVNQEFYASNVLIKDGILGLTSHHAIHGNNGNNIIIENVNINSFDVAGIGLNGCNNIEIIDCIVGPQNNNIPVLGRYTHARSILPRLKQFVDNFGDEMITFSNRDSISIINLADKLIKQMDMVYFYVMNDNEYDEYDEDWIAAKKLFINLNGLMDAGSSYGIVLNGEGSATLSIGQRIENTKNIILSNVEIMGIYNGAVEKVKSVTINDDNGALRGILSDPIDWEAVVDQINNPLESKYIGDAYTDIIFAMNKLQKKTDWYFLHCMRITDEIEEFIFNGDSTKFISNSIDIKCNTDIQMHTNKGAIGLRIDGVENIELNNIYIHDIINYANLGSNICGEYEVSTISKEDKDIQYGYTGTRSHGLIIDYATGIFNDITIENIYSHYGSSWAIIIYKGCNINLKGDIKLNNIYAGSELTIYDIQTLKLPNFIPKSCSIEISIDSNVIDIDNGVIGDTVIGFDLCSDDEQIGICDNCYIKSNDNPIINRNNINPPIWLISVIFIAVFSLFACCIKILYANHHLKLLKIIQINQETVPLLA